jgi:two-component system, cell cycle sensor histidine kinase and response regulator CckA
MPSVERAQPRGNETVLLVDDEPSIRRAGSRMLVRFGYRVLTAADGREAVDCLEQHRPAIDVVVTDMVMPNMDARDLIGIIRQRWPDLPVLLSTGYDAGRLGQDDLRLFTGLVPKPYTPEEMLRAVRKALDARR